MSQLNASRILPRRGTRDHGRCRGTGRSPCGRPPDSVGQQPLAADQEEENQAVEHARHPERHLQRRSEEHTSELQSHSDLVCRLLLEKKKKKTDKEEIHTNKQAM